MIMASVRNSDFSWIALQTYAKYTPTIALSTIPTKKLFDHSKTPKIHTKCTSNLSSLHQYNSCLKQTPRKYIYLLAIKSHAKPFCRMCDAMRIGLKMGLRSNINHDLINWRTLHLSLMKFLIVGMSCWYYSRWRKKNILAIFCVRKLYKHLGFIIRRSHV